MLQSSQKRIKRQCNHHQFSHVDLPYDVLENIFSFLPIKHAAQMGILSPRFRNLWMVSRNLYFDKEFARGRDQEDIIRIVNHIFYLHSGPIRSFRLCFNSTGVENIVEKWIKNSTDKGVEELDLDFFQNVDPFKLSSGIIDIESITILKLCFCEVDLPPKLQGLNLLNTLVLKKVNVRSTLLEIVFRNCMLLESLDLIQCFTSFLLKISARDLKNFKFLRVGDCLYLDRIHIDAPTLRSLEYCGFAVIFKSQDVLQLNDVMLNFKPSKSFPRYIQHGIIAPHLFHVSILSTSGIFLEGLCSRIMERRSREIQQCFGNLKEFQLFMKGANFCNVYDIASFLNNCPCLEKFFIDLNEFSFECGYYWELHHRELLEEYNEPLRNLRFIKIKGFKFQKYEIELVKFLLQKAIFLENLVLVTPKNNSRAKFNYGSDVLVYYDKTFNSWRTSLNAQIKIYEHPKDKSFVDPKHSKIWT